jgi:hypothetical protein
VLHALLRGVQVTIHPSGSSAMAVAQAQKTKVITNERNYIRNQLLTGRSLKGAALSDAKLSELWPKLLDLQVASVRPGRAVALSDVAYMTEHRRFRVTIGAMWGESASSSDGPRELKDAEVVAIAAWLEAHRAATPAAAADLRATEELRQGRP